MPQQSAPCQIARGHKKGPREAGLFVAADRLKHDPEKCAAVFRKDHAQTTT
jgi:hypothetical protein